MFLSLSLSLSVNHVVFACPLLSLFYLMAEYATLGTRAPVYGSLNVREFLVEML